MSRLTASLGFKIWLFCCLVVPLAAGCHSNPDSAGIEFGAGPDAADLPDIPEQALLDSPEQEREQDVAVFSCQSPSWLRVITANMGHIEFSDPDSTADFLVDFTNSTDDVVDFVISQAMFLRQSLALPGEGNVFALQEIDMWEASTGYWWWSWVFEDIFNSVPDPICSQNDYDRYFAEIQNDGTGNLLLSNISTSELQTWLLGSDPVDCDEPTDRPARAIHLVEGNVDAWVVDVHLAPCLADDYEPNFCNLNNLVQGILALPVDDIVVVAGDFNIKNGTGQCGNIDYSDRYSTMTNVFSAMGFLKVISTGRDHIFVRDPQFKLKPFENNRKYAIVDTLMPIDVSLYPSQTKTDQGDYKISDHSFLSIDIAFAGSGISPVLLPTLVSIL